MNPPAPPTSATWRRCSLGSVAAMVFSATVILGAGALATDGYPKLAAWLVVASVASAAGAIALAGRRSTPVVAVVLGAIALRWIVGAILLVVLTPRGHFGVFSPDEIGYDRVAATLSSGDPVPRGLQYLVSPFTWLISIAYDVGGSDPLAGKAVISACAILTVGVVYRITLVASGVPLAAIVAAILFAAWPTTLGWSVLLLKDSTTMLAVALGVMGLFECLRRRFVYGLSCALVGIAWLTVTRPSDAAVILTGAIVVGATWFAARSLTGVVATVVVVLVILSTVAFVPALRGKVDTAPDELRTHRVLNSSGNTRLGANRDITKESNADSTWPRELTRFPSAAAEVWLRPAPWEFVGATSRSQRLGAASAPLWYVGLLFATLGVLTLTRRGRPWAAWILAAPVIVSIVPLAMGEGNLGTAFRHRDSVTALVLILASVGVVAVAERIHPIRWVSASYRRSASASVG